MTRKFSPGTMGAALLAVCLLACGSNDDVVRPAGPELSAERTPTGENAAPVIEAIRFDPEAPVEDDQLRVRVVARDPDGDPVDVSLRWFVDGVAIAGDSLELDLAEHPGAKEVTVVAVASDGRHETGEERASVRLADRPPLIATFSIDPVPMVAPGESVRVSATASDPDGDRVAIEYEWFVNGESASGIGSEFPTDGLVMGDEIHARVTAVSRGQRSVPQESARVRVGSTHPEIVSNPPGLLEGGVFDYQIEAVDPDGDRLLRYRLDSAPSGMTIDEILGRIQWRPQADQAGAHEVAVVVRDSAGLETTQKFYVTVRTVESAPPAAAVD